MFRHAVFALALLPSVALAQGACEGEDLIATLSPEDRALIRERAQAQPFHEGILWQATKPDSTVTVVGTMHLPDPRHDALVSSLSPAVQDADLLILEITREDETRMQELAADRPERFFIQDGPTLIDLLGPDDWALAKERLEARGIPPFFAAQFQPWYLSMTLGLPPCALEAMAGGQKGLDRRLEVVAEEAGVDLAALDEPDVILNLFGNEPIEDQVEALRFGLHSDMNGDAMMATMLDAYFDGRIAETWEFMRLEADRIDEGRWAGDMDEMEDLILIGRNRQWEPKIAELVEGQDVVLAVGAGHLPGETGVLRALERLGYKVSPLN